MADIFKNAMMSDDIVYLTSFLAPVELSLEKAVIPAEKVTDINEPFLSALQAQETGFNQGFAAGLAEAHTQMAEQIHALNVLLQSIPVAISENRLQLSTEIADIVLSIAQQFFIHQQQDEEAIALQITQTITQLNDKQNIELSLHPQDLALLKQDKIKIDLKQYKNLRVTSDDSLRLGGCIVRSEHGVFDAGIERQIDNLKNVLLRMKHGELRE